MSKQTEYEKQLRECLEVIRNGFDGYPAVLKDKSLSDFSAFFHRRVFLVENDRTPTLESEAGQSYNRTTCTIYHPYKGSAYAGYCCVGFPKRLLRRVSPFGLAVRQPCDSGIKTAHVDGQSEKTASEKTG